MIVERFYPDEYVDSTYGIDFEKLRKRGIRGLLFDIDNTLVPHGKPATKESVELFQRLHELGFETCLISNNQKPRVEPFAKAMKTRYLYNAHKPSPKNYLLCHGKDGNGAHRHLCLSVISCSPMCGVRKKPGSTAFW